MELRQLQSFVAVAEARGFSRAAQKLHLSQSALSRQIRHLEENLGVLLFHRHLGGGIELTEAGLGLLEGARYLLQEARDLMQKVQSLAPVDGAVPGELRLAHFGTMMALYLTPFLEPLTRYFPGLKIALEEEWPDVALERLKRGELDALVIGRPGEDRLSDLDYRVISTAQPLLVLPAHHRLAKKRQISLRQLDGEKLCVWNEDRFPGFGSPFLEACQAAGILPEATRRIESLEGMLTAVALEGWVGYAGEPALRNPPPGVVVSRLQPGSVDLPIILAWRRDAPHGDICRRLADLLQPAPGPVDSSGGRLMRKR